MCNWRQFMASGNVIAWSIPKRMFSVLYRSSLQCCCISFFLIKYSTLVLSCSFCTAAEIDHKPGELDYSFCRSFAEQWNAETPCGTYPLPTSIWKKIRIKVESNIQNKCLQLCWMGPHFCWTFFSWHQQPLSGFLLRYLAGGYFCTPWYSLCTKLMQKYNYNSHTDIDHPQY